MGSDSNTTDPEKVSKRPKQRGGAKVPIVGNVAHNSAFLVAIGGLVVSWANNESVFLAMLQLLVPSGNSRSAAIVWHSHRTSQARIELVGRLCRQHVKDKVLVGEINKAILDFKGFSKTRNFYCHALYHYAPSDLCLVKATGATMAQEDEPIRFEDKKLDAAALNEISDAIVRMGTFNMSLWKLVLRLQDALGVRQIELPQLLREQIESQGGHPQHSGEGGSPKAPPKSSQE